MPDPSPLPEPRRYTGQRSLRIAARTAHIGAAALTLGAATFVDPTSRAQVAEHWAGFALLTGILIVCDDLFKWGLLYLRMIQAWVVAVKLALILVGLAHPSLLAPCLWAALVLGSVVSHAPGRLRHLRPL